MRTRRKLLASLPTRAEGAFIMGSMRLAFVAVFVAAIVVPALAQSSYPDRNIRLLFGFPPGTDTAVRLLADKLGEAVGKPVIVENVTGAAGNIAADRIAKATPDGYTIGVLASPSVVINGSLYKKLPYDPVKDLAPVTQVYGIPTVLVVNNDVPAKSVAELVALARASPGKLMVGHPGLGSAGYLAGELLNFMAHIDVQQVPFRGSSLVITDVMGGQITMSFVPPITSLSLIRDGKIRALAVTSLKRAPFLADIPTMDESEFPGFDVTVWYGLFVPARTSREIIEKLHRETVKIMSLPDVREKLHAIGGVPLHNTPAEFVDVIRAETPYWARVIKDTGIKPVE
jgi:tripartite-type tricarboxylate transporter receptor subunit TctC